MAELNVNRSHRLFEEAKQYIPGGVNSPVRAFKSVGMEPLFIDKASGSRIMDVDGNEFIDYVGSWGPMIWGHGDADISQAVIEAVRNGTSYGAPCPREVEMARLITSCVPSVEVVRMVNSGTEAVMSAIRLARGVTGRAKIIKFDGCYHGHSDSLLVKAGSGLATLGQSDSEGVPSDFTRHTIVAEYNNPESVEAAFAVGGGDVACLIVEPVAGNMGVVPPEKDFLPFLREITTRHSALLIMDEVITGFRLSLGGAQQHYGVMADLTTMGKIIGGGFPVGAYGGKQELMRHIAPDGGVYQAGTLSGNPVAMAAGITSISKLKDNPSIYQELDEKGKLLEDGLQAIIDRHHVNATINRVGSMLSLFFTDHEVRRYADAKACDTARFSQFFAHMLQGGVYLPPSQFETLFVSARHTPEDICRTLDVAEAFFGG